MKLKRKKESRGETVFDEMMAENFLKLIENMSSQM